MKDDALVVITPPAKDRRILSARPELMADTIEEMEFELEMGRGIREDQQRPEYQPERQRGSAIDCPLSPHGWD